MKPLKKTEAPASSIPTGEAGSLANAFLLLSQMPHALSAAELQRWFNKKVLPRQVAVDLASEITKLRIAELQLSEKRSESYERIAGALHILRTELDPYIFRRLEMADEIIAPRILELSQQQKALMITLAQAATELVDGQSMFVRRRPGGQHTEWHALAGYLGPKIVNALKAAGVIGMPHAGRSSWASWYR